MLLLQQKPPISEIIAIVDWCEPYILAEGDLPPHLWHNARACARRSRGVFFLSCVRNRDLSFSFQADIWFIWIVIIYPI